MSTTKLSIDWGYIHLNWCYSILQASKHSSMFGRIGQISSIYCPGGRFPFSTKQLLPRIINTITWTPDRTPKLFQGCYNLNCRRTPHQLQSPTSIFSLSTSHFRILLSVPLAFFSFLRLFTLSPGSSGTLCNYCGKNSLFDPSNQSVAQAPSSRLQAPISTSDTSQYGQQASQRTALPGRAYGLIAASR